MLEGELPGCFERLRASVLDLDDGCRFRLAFSRDADGRVRIRGQVAARGHLECQRCLEPVAIALGGEVRLEVVWPGEDPARVAEGFEALELDAEASAEGEPAAPAPAEARVGGETLTIEKLVEDELLLSLPTVGLHDDEHCHRAPPTDAAAPEQTRRETNPFAALAALRESD